MAKKEALLKNTRLLFGVNLLVTLSLFSPVEVIYLENLHVSTALISGMNLTVPLVMVIMDTPTGILADYLGRKQIMFLAALAFVLNMLIFLLATEIWALFLAYVLEGVAWSLYSGNTDAIVVEDSLAKKIDVSRQLMYFYSGLSLGPLIAGGLSSSLNLLPTSASFKIAILVTGLIRCGAFLLVFFVTPLHKGMERKHPFQQFRTLFLESTRLLFNPFSIALVIYEAAGRLEFYMPVLFQPLALKSGLALAYFGLVYSLGQLFQYIVQRRVDSLITLLGFRRVLIWNPVVLALGVCLLLVPNLWFIAAGYFLTRLMSPFRQQILALKKNEFAPNRIRATYLSVLSALALALNSLYLGAVGLLLDSASTIALLIIVGICLAGGLGTWKIIDSYQRTNARQVFETGKPV